MASLKNDNALLTLGVRKQYNLLVQPRGVDYALEHLDRLSGTNDAVFLGDMRDALLEIENMPIWNDRYDLLLKRVEEKLLN